MSGLTPRGTGRPLEGEGEAQRSLGVGVNSTQRTGLGPEGRSEAKGQRPQGLPRTLRPLGEAVAQQRLGVGVNSAQRSLGVGVHPSHALSRPRAAAMRCQRVSAVASI